MKLHSLQIEGFRKHHNTTIVFSDSTFLIGENNVGKSSILFALDYLLNVKARIPNDEYYSITEEGKKKCLAENIILTAEFRNLPAEAKTWRGFKGRILSYTPSSESDTGLKFVYRKTFPLGGNAIIETHEYQRKIKESYYGCQTIDDFLAAGVSSDILTEDIKKIKSDKKITPNDLKLFLNIEELCDVDETTNDWVKNPGGIPQIVMCKLPKYLLIPAQDKEDEITGTSGTLQNTLNELFSEVRDISENYKKAQEYLDKLAKELDPTDESTEVFKMIKELNGIVSEVFPNTGISASTNLSDAKKVIKPVFDIEMNSNISTVTKLQGTGLIRSTVFALLRYKCLRDNKKDNSGRPLIIGFEEPEIYLHPNAINKMRDIIYNLAETGNNQIVCTTHSPYMIDISKKPTQVLNNLCIELSSNPCAKEMIQIVKSVPFNVTDEFLKLHGDTRDYIKMILKVDDVIAKSFFVKKVLIVEGDTEQVVLTETINRIPDHLKTIILSDWHVVRARGKAAIIPLIKYLKSMSIDIHVMHDGDLATAGAIKFNEPIRSALDNDSKLVVLDNCIEDLLGYPAPNSDKPFKAYKHILDNWSDWNSLPVNWRKCIEKIFNNCNIISIESHVS